jgi:hypothetical protein
MNAKLEAAGDLQQSEPINQASNTDSSS